MATKVRFTDRSNPPREPGPLLAEISVITELTFKNVHKTPNGTILVVPNENMAELFAPATLSKLMEKGIEAYPPIEFQAKRTIFVHRVSEFIMDHLADEIGMELE